LRGSTVLLHAECDAMAAHRLAQEMSAGIKPVGLVNTVKSGRSQSKMPRQTNLKRLCRQEADFV
jgi:hypothetical protein